MRIADLLKKHMKPGLVGANAALALATKTNSTTVTFGAFGPGDMMVTGGAVCTGYLIDHVNFATAGDDGGPLPVGTYAVYFDVQQGGTSASRFYLANPLPTTQASAESVIDPSDVAAWRIGTPDPEIYLTTLTGLVWNGAQFTNSDAWWAGLADAHKAKNMWGTFPATLLMRGDFYNAKFGESDAGAPMGRGLEMISPLVIEALALQQLTIGAGGELDFEADAAMNSGDNFACHLNGDSQEIVAENGGLLIDLGDGSQLKLGASTLEIQAGGEIGIDADATLAIEGRLNAIAGSQVNFAGVVNFEEGSDEAIDPDADMNFAVGQDLTATPAQNKVTNAGIVKAWASVSFNEADAPQLEFAALNISATLGHVGRGIVALKFLRGFVNPTQFVPVPTILGTADYRATALVGGAPGCDVTVYIRDGSGNLVDWPFNLVVLGGDQVGD